MSRALSSKLTAEWAKKRQVSATMVAFVEVVKALQHHAHTRIELCEVSGLGNNTVVSILNLMRKRHMIFVKKWKRRSDRGQWAEAFMLGDEEDAPKPRAMTAKQYKERYLIKKRLEAQGVRNVALAYDE